ncbi:hypothetical protein V1477_004416 [Vespula maculifrons]|uniref:Uncharacterized protein n=1 Tax=Vespula maculifrons TaxID=7453 RepID=A0ABD2CSG9_VESMC
MYIKLEFESLQEVKLIFKNALQIQTSMYDKMKKIFCLSQRSYKRNITEFCSITSTSYSR